MNIREEVKSGILVYTWAKLPLRKVVIEPGGTLRVERTERADRMMPEDRSMSAVHGEIRWDGELVRFTGHAAPVPLTSARASAPAGPELDT